jgi:tyrosine-protein kinase Etk/Wzc
MPVQGVDGLPEAGSSEKAIGVSPYFVLAALTAKRKLVIAFTLAFFILGVLACLLLRPYYTAITVLPPNDNNSGLSGLAGGATVLALGGHSTGELYVKLLESTTIADALIAEFHLEQVYKLKKVSLTRRALTARTTVILDEKSNLITISVTDKNAQRSSDLANGYVTQYQKLSAHLAISEASRKRAFFGQQLLASKNNLADAEERLANIQKQTGFLAPDSQTQALISSAANLRAQVAVKQVQIEAMRNYATAENPQMQQAETELSGLEAQLGTLEHSDVGGANSLILPKNAVQNGGVEYIRGLRDVKYYETLYDMLARQLEAARLEEAREGNGIEVVDPAIPPDRKSGPKRSLILAGSLVFGFLAGCCWVLGSLAYADFRIRMREAEQGSPSLP